MTIKERTFNIPLRLVIWNACGLTNKVMVLPDFIREHQIDVVLITETWLHHGVSFKLANYKVYRTDRLNGSGGATAVPIRSHLKCSQIPVPAVKMHIGDFGPLHVYYFTHYRKERCEDVPGGFSIPKATAWLPKFGQR